MLNMVETLLDTGQTNIITAKSFPFERSVSPISPFSKETVYLILASLQVTPCLPRCSMKTVCDIARDFRCQETNILKK